MFQSLPSPFTSCMQLYCKYYCLSLCVPEFTYRSPCPNVHRNSLCLNVHLTTFSVLTLPVPAFTYYSPCPCASDFTYNSQQSLSQSSHIISLSQCSRITLPVPVFTSLFLSQDHLSLSLSQCSPMTLPVLMFTYL